MTTYTARIVDSTHLELTAPISVPAGEYVQVSIPDSEDEEKLWKEAGKKHFLEAYAEEDAVYDNV